MSYKKRYLIEGKRHSSQNQSFVFPPQTSFLFLHIFLLIPSNYIYRKILSYNQKKEKSMTLHKIRKAYDENYNKILHTIQKMGGDSNIKTHRKKGTTLYQSLKRLQQREHYLDKLESRLLQPEENLQAS
jgi:hypothetical protein